MVCFFSCCSLRDGFDILMLFAVVITGACVMHCIGSQAAQFAGAARLLWVSRLVLCVCGPWREYVLKLPRLMWGTKRQALCKPRPVWCRQPWIYFLSAMERACAQCGGLQLEGPVGVLFYGTAFIGTTFFLMCVFTLLLIINSTQALVPGPKNL